MMSIVRSTAHTRKDIIHFLDILEEDLSSGTILHPENYVPSLSVGFLLI